jgi:hypothetical protein
LIPAIRFAKPKVDPYRTPMETGIRWLAKLILRLEPLGRARDAAIKKLKDTLFRLQLVRTNIQRRAKDETPDGLAMILRYWPAERPLYH